MFFKVALHFLKITVFMRSDIQGDFYSFNPKSSEMGTFILEAASCQPSTTPNVIFLASVVDSYPELPLPLPTIGIPSKNS